MKRQVLRISELADMIKVSRSTTHRYAQTLVELGCLEQDRKHRYRLAHGIAGAGAAFISTLRLETPEAWKVLEELRDVTGYTVSMGVLDGARVLYTYRLFGHGRGQYEADLDLDVGASVPVYCTAIGKVLLGGLSSTEQQQVVAGLKLVPRGPNTITKKRVLLEELLAARAVGIAVCDEEQAKGVRSIAAAITHTGHSRPMALSITVPAESMSVATMTAKLGPRLLAAAEQI